MLWLNNGFFPESQLRVGVPIFSVSGVLGAVVPFR